LFRGYSAYMTAILFWMSLLPICSNYLLQKLPLYLDPSRVQESLDLPQEEAFDFKDIEYEFDEEEDD
jgi:hypothetical protein